MDAQMCKMASDLQDTLEECRQILGFGRGIAAPQIGVPVRMVFTNVDAPRHLVNPRIVFSSTETMALWDDCLSVPDFLVWVRRSRSITVEYQDLQGENHSWQARDAVAELLQHEIDHLDGVLLIDRAHGPNAVYSRDEYLRQVCKWPALAFRGPMV